MMGRTVEHVFAFVKRQNTFSSSGVNGGRVLESAPHWFLIAFRQAAD
jgi:hypothetical protein